MAVGAGLARSRLHVISSYRSQREDRLICRLLKAGVEVDEGQVGGDGVDARGRDHYETSV